MSVEVTRVFVADDDDRMRSVIREIIEMELDLLVVGEAKDAPTTLHLVSELNPHVVVTDVWMPGGGGIAVCEGIKSVAPRTRVVAISGSTWDGTSESVLKAGASGFLIKDHAITDLAPLIRSVAWEQRVG